MIWEPKVVYGIERIWVKVKVDIGRLLYNREATLNNVRSIFHSRMNEMANSFGVDILLDDIELVQSAIDEPCFEVTYIGRWHPNVTTIEFVNGPQKGEIWNVRPTHLKDPIFGLLPTVPMWDETPELPTVPLADRRVLYEWVGWNEATRNWVYKAPDKPRTREGLSAENFRRALEELVYRHPSSMSALVQAFGGIPSGENLTEEHRASLLLALKQMMGD